MIVDAEQATSLTDALLGCGAASVDIADAHAGRGGEQPIFAEPGAEAVPAWQEHRLVALFPEHADVQRALTEAAGEAGLALPSYGIGRVEEQDWVRLTQSQFAPIRISQRLWISPSWGVVPDPAALTVVLDPGLAFGTGSHPTTRLCLQWLDQHLQPGQSVIDYGCGSGILAIAAARLGAAHVVGIDIDPQALQTSRYNAERNDVAIEWLTADAPAPAPADVTIANILSAPLAALAPLLARLTRSGGHLVLSGILPAQVENLTRIYRPWFDLRVGAIEEGWVRLDGIMRAGVAALRQ
jgi:ribosomal protein L11 methyltransferase